MEIRPPNKQNYDDIAPVLSEALGVKVSVALLADRVLYDPNYDPNHCNIAREKGKTLGYLAAVRRGEVGHLKLLAVSPAAQRRGIAKEMLGRMEDRLAGEGARRMVVGPAPPSDFFPGVPQRYEGARRFFEAMGYKHQADSWTASIHPQGSGGEWFRCGAFEKYKELLQGERASWYEAVEEAFTHQPPQAVAADLKGGPALLLARPGRLGPLFYAGDDADPALKDLVQAGAEESTQSGPAGLRDERPLAWWQARCNVAASGTCAIFEKTLT